MRTLTLVLAAGCAAAAMPAAAQTLKPGLWEIQHEAGDNAEIEQGRAEMQKQLSAMPLEQRRQMEAMMASRGVQLAPAENGGTRMKICLTREMVERNDIPAMRGECKTTQQQRSGNSLKLAFTCSKPPSSGDTQVTFHGSEAFTTRTRVTAAGDGKPETMTMEGRGRWLSADCGAVQPIQPAK